MTDSDPRQNAKIDNRKASNAQDLETQMTAVGRAAHLSLSTQLFVQKLVFTFMDMIVADLLSACLKVVDNMP